MIGQKAMPFYRDGGVERQVEGLATRLAKAGHHVLVYVRPRYMATKEDIWQGVELKHLPTIPTKHLDTWSHTFLASLHVLGQKADIIHYHSVGPSTLSFIPHFFKPKSGLVATFHCIDRFHKKWGPFARAYLRFGEWTATHWSDATIAISQDIQKYCCEKFKKDAYLVHYGIEIKNNLAANELDRWGLEPNRYLITVARLIRHKGIHYLIEAFKKIPENLKGELKLVIVGAPSFTADYEKYLKNLAAEDHRIIFTGFQNGEVLDQLYAHSLFCVHPSEAEGLSIAILEGMSFGKCVVAADTPENLEAINNYGISFVSQNVEDLRDKIISLLNHPEIAEAKGRGALKFIKDNFSWDKVTEQTEEIYYQVLKNKNK